MQLKRFVLNMFTILKETFMGFIDDNGMKLSAALSYYTIFSLPPLLIIIISLSGFFFGAEAVNGELFWQINGVVGNDVAIQIQDEESGRWHAMHHPFTSALPGDLHLLDGDPGAVRANAYDLVINGVEIGGGSIRIHDKSIQKKMFSVLGFTDEEAQKQFGFLMNAFEFGAPPHGGIAFGFDRLCSMFGGSESIRDYIAFPKNNSGRDMMIDSPATISAEQLKELGIRVAG